MQCKGKTGCLVYIISNGLVPVDLCNLKYHLVTFLLFIQDFKLKNPVEFG